MNTKSRTIKRSLSNAAIFFLLFILVSFSPGSAFANDAPPKVAIQSSGHIIQGRPAHLSLHIAPAPSKKHPLHLHLYIDGKMVLMTTATRSETRLTLPPLKPGRHQVTVVQADMTTHREMGEMKGMEMDGMDMGGMSGMKKPTASSSKGNLASLWVVVKKSKP